MSPQQQLLREWDGQAAIPMAEWGKDHWSTLAFVECKCVDGSKGVAKLTGGTLDHLKCNPRRHRTFLGSSSLTLGSAWADEYSTVLADGSLVLKHDDWDCINDMVAAGLVLNRGEGAKGGQPFGGGWVKLQLTDLGILLAGELRAHKAKGGTWGTFSPTAPVPVSRPSSLRRPRQHRRGK